MKNYKKDIDKLKDHGLISDESYDQTVNIIEKLREEVEEKKRINDNTMKSLNLDIDKTYFFKKRNLFAI